MDKFYYIRTYGCQMNIHDSEKIAGILEELGYTVCDSVEQADVVVFNTCCIRENRRAKNLRPYRSDKKTQTEKAFVDSCRVRLHVATARRGG